MNWYRIETREVFHELGASENGLTDKEVQERLARFGPNKLAEEEKIGRLKILLHQFASPLIYILIIAGIVTVILEEYVDSSVIFAVVVLNAVIGFTQEYKAETSVKALMKMVVPKAKVVRNGIEKEINSKYLVPGDIVLLASGAKVPADLRLFHAIELKAEESMLTGESLPSEKITIPIDEENLTPGDWKNMVFMGTAIVNGRARGIVVETGGRTVLGSIAREVGEIGLVKAPLQEKIDGFARTIGVIVLAASSLLFLLGILVGESAKDMFMTAVAAAVATIPEGLPIVVTISMAIGVARMARQNAIVRKLPAVETLGSTTVIGSDKTGTLTKNEMTVKLIYDGKHTYEVEGSGYEPEGNILFEGMQVEDEDRKRLVDLLRTGLLCNESAVYEEDGQYKVDGDPTEGALVVSAIKGGLSPEEEKELHRQVAVIPFESDRGYMATLHALNGEKRLFVKGAFEKILEMCVRNGEGGEIWKKEVTHIAGNFAREGLRVLAFAYKELPGDAEDISHHDAESGLTFAGLQGMIDPPRPEAIEAIEGCKKAGIRVVMITGDHAVTAGVIARKLGIAVADAEVLSGSEIESMSEDELFEKVKSVSVYARVAPHHKLRIARQLMRRGEILAVTGDGVNDAPALKAAHIGVAMGKGGTDVAKEASDMVLTDDNFASIFNASGKAGSSSTTLERWSSSLSPPG